MCTLFIFEFITRTPCSPIYTVQLIYVFECISATCGQVESIRMHLPISTFIIRTVGALYMLVNVCGSSKSKSAGRELR